MSIDILAQYYLPFAKHHTTEQPNSFPTSAAPSPTSPTSRSQQSLPSPPSPSAAASSLPSLLTSASSPPMQPSACLKPASASSPAPAAPSACPPSSASPARAISSSPAAASPPQRLTSLVLPTASSRLSPRMSAMGRRSCRSRANPPCQRLSGWLRRSVKEDPLLSVLDCRPLPGPGRRRRMRCTRGLSILKIEMRR